MQESGAGFFSSGFTRKKALTERQVWHVLQAMRIWFAGLILLVGTIFLIVTFSTPSKPRASVEVKVAHYAVSDFLALASNHPHCRDLVAEPIGKSGWVRLTMTGPTDAAAKRDLDEMVESMVRWGIKREGLFLGAQAGMACMGGAVAYSDGYSSASEWRWRMQERLKSLMSFR